VPHASVNLLPKRSFRTLGYCAWCGRTGEGVVLREEHIVPASFGGHLTLRDGCCLDCQGPQSAYIGQCCRSMFPALRLHHGIAGRKSTTKTIPVMVSNSDFIPLAPHEAPGIVTLPVFEMPDMITGFSREENAVPMIHTYIVETTEDGKERSISLKESGRALGLAYAEIPLGHFVRTLAHIGHAFYLGAADDSTREKSLLLPIANGNLRRASRVIGGWPLNAPSLPQPKPESGIHQIRPVNAMIDGVSYVMALIWLFTYLRPLPPVYAALLCQRDIAEGDKYLSFTRHEEAKTINVEELTMGA